jgi:hypothetical protein
MPRDGVSRDPAGGESSAGDPPGGAAAMERGYARGRAKNDAVRAGLEPLRAGERPAAVTVAAILAALLVIANVVVYIAGWDVNGSQPSLRGLLAYSVVLGAAAVGMWRGKYWAVLGFEMLLAITIILTAAVLLRASNWQALVFCAGILAVCGPLFWFLIRAMARLQMPTRTR